MQEVRGSRRTRLSSLRQIPTRTSHPCYHDYYLIDIARSCQEQERDPYYRALSRPPLLPSLHPALFCAHIPHRIATPESLVGLCPPSPWERAACRPKGSREERATRFGIRLCLLLRPISLIALIITEP